MSKGGAIKTVPDAFPDTGDLQVHPETLKAYLRVQPNEVWLRQICVPWPQTPVQENIVEDILVLITQTQLPPPCS